VNRRLWLIFNQKTTTVLFLPWLKQLAFHSSGHRFGYSERRTRRTFIHSNTPKTLHFFIHRLYGGEHYQWEFGVFNVILLTTAEMSRFLCRFLVWSAGYFYILMTYFYTLWSEQIVYRKRNKGPIIYNKQIWHTFLTLCRQISKTKKLFTTQIKRKHDYYVDHKEKT